MLRKELDTMNRKKVILEFAKLYQKATSKKEKNRILTDFLKLMNYNRSYAAWLLRHAGKKVQVKTSNGTKVILVANPYRKIKRKRPKIYDHKVLKPLKKIWAILDYPCSLKLKASLPKIIPQS